MANVIEPVELLMDANDRIDWVLAHPGMSGWLKDALRTSVDRNPVDVLNDLETLSVLLRSRSRAQIEAGLSTSAPRISSSDPFLSGLFQRSSQAAPFSSSQRGG